MYLKFLFCVIGLLFWETVSAVPKQNLTDSLRRELSLASDINDSLLILYNLYDLALPKEQPAWGWQIYEVAGRVHDDAVRMDILRRLAVHYMENDTLMLRLVQLAKELPESEEQKECVVFIRLQRIFSQAKHVHDNEQRRQMLKSFEKDNIGKDKDFYANLLHLYSLCIYLGQTTSGALYSQYLERLEEQIRLLPSHLYAIRNQFYTQCAIAYTNNENYQKALAADRELIKIIKDLERKYSAMGRRYRNYDINYYICYRRMLNNYEGLTEEEIEELYDKIVLLCKRNKDVQNDFHDNPRATVFYLMTKKKYAEAIPYIRKVLAHKLSLTQKRQMLVLLKKAATRTGDSATLLHTLSEYNDVLEEYSRKNSAEFYRELQIRYDVDELKTQNTELELQKRRSEVIYNRKISMIVQSAFAIVFLILIGVFWLYYRSRKLTKRLMHYTDALQEERNELKNTQAKLTQAYERVETANRAKSEFLHSMSHEVRTPLNAILGFSQLIVKKMPQDTQEKLGKFAQIIALNTDYLTTLINDILDVSSLEGGEMLCEPVWTTIHSMGKMAVENMKGRAKPGVVMKFEPTTSDINVQTDRKRVEQVLVNLLGNAAKFTDSGEIILTYQVDFSTQLLTFTVTDTGKGIPSGKEEIVFDRFVKLDPFMQGSGLGLYLCRQIANMLEGKIYVDTRYKQGARFCFVIPMN